MAPGRKRKKLAAKSTKVTKQANLTTDNTEISLESHAAKIRNSVQKARKSSQESLRKEMKEFRKDLEYSRTSRGDPLQIFPHEIWEMILNFVDDVNQLANCTNVCTLFQAAVNSSPQELLFGKVIPFVFPYFEEDDDFRENLQMFTLVVCGQVCKKWRAGVDSFADSYFCTEKFFSNTLNKLKLEPIKYFKNKSLLSKSGFYDKLPISEEEKEELIAAGRYIVPQPESSDSDSDSDDDNVNHMAQVRRPFRRYMRKKRKEVKIGNFPFLTLNFIHPAEKPSKWASLKVHGKLLHVTCLQVGQDTWKRSTVQQFCAAYEKVLEYCPNMTELSLHYTNEDMIIGAKCKEKTFMEQLTSAKHPKLENFHVSETSEGILPIQTGILSKLCSTLEHVQVYHWNDKMSSFQWNKLTCLEILGGTAAKVLKTLENMKAQNLHKLHLRLDSRSLKLTQLFRTINQFPNLECLKLVITDAGEICSQKDICDVPLEVLTTNRITTLKLVTRHLKVSRDIPLLFPMVRNLTFVYGNHLRTHIYIDDTTESYADEGSDDDIDSNSEDNESNPKQDHCIQIYEGTLMYQSNIWSLLPQLENLKIVKEPGYANPNFSFDGRVKRFTRQGYYFETEKYLAGQQLHLKHVWKEADEHVREKIEIDVTLLEQEAASRKLRSRAKAARTPNQIKEQLNKQALPFIVPMLARKDFLNCRLVSKSWWRSIDDKNKPIYKFEFPLTKKFQKERFKSDLRKCQAAPFFARNIEIRITNKASYAADVSLLLKEIGKHVTKLTISAEEKVVTNLAEIYQICVETTKQCPELRMWSLQIPNPHCNGQAEYKKLKTTNKLLSLENLEQITIYEPQCKWGTELQMIFHDLGNMCYSQLKSFQRVKFNFNLMYCYNVFERLEELTFTDYVPEEPSEDFGFESIVPNLKRLCLCLNDRDITVDFLSVLTRDHIHFTCLELQFSSTFHGFNTNLIYSEPYNTVDVMSVKVVFKNQYQVSLDFLVHMPFVRNLSIVYGKGAKMLNYKRQVPKKYVDAQNVSIFPPRKPEKDFIQLVRCFKDAKRQNHDVENIYGSNIWRVLRRLQTLEIVYCSNDESQKVAVFRRRQTIPQ